MKNSRGRGFLCLLIAVAAIAVFGYFGYVSAGDVKLGLDLAGGVSITYQAVGDATDEQMDDTVYKLRKRVDTYSTEADVYREGSDRINIDIPGVTDANAILETLGQPGSLRFTDMDGNTILTGDQVASAKAGVTDSNGSKEYLVSLTFNEEGTKAFADATSSRIGQQIAIVYDGEVVSAPVVREAITQGQCTIDGIGSYEEAENLASTIRIGALSVELTELRSNVVGARLGQEAITTSLQAGAVGFAVVAVFMIAVYLVPGLAAALALALYVGLMVLLLVAFEVTLTLPGIAGIILSIGMAVDANVIIFTRIKEEIGAGKTVETAIKTGFEKALSAIVDGNVTTLIAALVLFWRGSGTVKGFATTLALGIVLSMFTALFVTRFILRALFRVGLQSPKFYGTKKDRKAFNFVGARKVTFVIPVIVIAIGIGTMVTGASSGRGAFNYSMEFMGGTSTNVTFNEDLSLDEISDQVVPLVEEVTGDADVQTQKVEGSNEVIIRTRTLSVEEREQLNQLLADNFGVDEEKITAESISGAISSEMRNDAVTAVVIATVCMLIYIWLRFKNIRFAASAVLALVHDVAVVATGYAVLRWSVGSNFIACMLTIVGYSINATIVIFDRIRENLKTAGRKKDLAELVNESITQTFTRSINTSLTTFIMVFVLYLMGVSTIREFALPLMTGIVCGAFSSVCITGPLWYVMTAGSRRKQAKAGE